MIRQDGPANDVDEGPARAPTTRCDRTAERRLNLHVDNLLRLAEGLESAHDDAEAGVSSMRFEMGEWIRTRDSSRSDSPPDVGRDAR